MVDYYLSKNLAGSSQKVSGEEFIAWAEAGQAPNDIARFLIREALGGLNGDEVDYVYFDGRTHPANIVKLIVDCGVDEDSEVWNNMIRTFHPELPVHPRKDAWDLHDKKLLADWNNNIYNW